MGTDLSLTNGASLFHVIELSNESPDEKAAVVKALSEHGVTSRKIPPGFQSPLYFRSIYYANNVRTQRWTNRSPLILSTNRLLNWSVENQIEAQVYRTLPANLSSVGHFVTHCFFDVGGGILGNGIARLITQFYGGFDEGNVENPIVLFGMPAFGKNSLTLSRCSQCDTQYSEAKGGGMKLCCGTVHYCIDDECKKRAWKDHESICVCDEVMERRKREAAAEEAKKRESAKANDDAEAAAASLLAELGLEEEEGELKKKKKNKNGVGGGEGQDDSKKKATKKGKNKKKK
jgi:hypothetical protein